MNKTSTSLRLKEILEKRGLKQVDVIKFCEPYYDKYGVRIGKNDLSQYVSGKNEPGQKKLFVLAKALNVSEAWLLGYDVPIERETTSSIPLDDPNVFIPKFNKVPLLGNIICGEPAIAIEQADEYVSIPDNIHADFALRCYGDSMINAHIHEDDIVYIKTQPTVENGEIAAVRIDGESTTLKRVYIYPNSVMLKPENDSYEPIMFQKEDMNRIDILGKAVYFLSRVK